MCGCTTVCPVAQWLTQCNCSFCGFGVGVCPVWVWALMWVWVSIRLCVCLSTRAVVLWARGGFVWSPNSSSSLLSLVWHRDPFAPHNPIPQISRLFKSAARLFNSNQGPKGPFVSPTPRSPNYSINTQGQLGAPLSMFLSKKIPTACFFSCSTFFLEREWGPCTKAPTLQRTNAPTNVPNRHAPPPRWY